MFLNLFSIFEQFKFNILFLPVFISYSNYFNVVLCLSIFFFIIIINKLFYKVNTTNIVYLLIIIILLFNSQIFSFFFNVSYSLFFLFIIIFLVTLFNNIIKNYYKYYYNGFIFSFFEIYLNFVNNMINDYLKKSGYKYLIFFSSLFIYIILFNVFGLFLFFGGITASFMFIFIFSFFSFFAMVSKKFLVTKHQFFTLFSPNELPKKLFSFFTILDSIVYLFRMLSLPLRLSVNIMTGHLLLKMFIMFSWSSLNNSFWLITIIPAAGIIFLIILVEFMACFVQAYVFIFLLIMYLSEIIGA